MTTNRRVLIIDDNPAIHEDYRRILGAPQTGSQGLDDAAAALFGDAAPSASSAPRFDLASAYQGQEAYERVQADLENDERFALALVDIRMPPGWDGVETIKRLWEIDDGLQCVIVSAYSDYDWETICERLGRTDRLTILRKPFDAIEILQVTLAMTEKWNLRHCLEAHLSQLDTLALSAGAEAEARRQRSQSLAADLSRAVWTLSDAVKKVAADLDSALAAGAPVVKARDETRRVQEVTELLDRLAQAAAAEASPEELRRCA